MTFYLSSRYKKDFRHLPQTIQDKLTRQLKTLAEYGITHPGLSVRKMTSVSEEIWEARIDIHFRFTFEVNGGNVLLRRVGTHEIYRNP